jgi:outer membrane immunogenic protein
VIHRWLVGTAAAALAVAGAISAQAADLPTRKEAPAPVFVPPPFTWTGFYVGGNAGAIWGQGNATTTLYANGFPLGAFNPFNVWPFGNLGNSNTGFIGGGQAGYNWQSGAWVFGVETDFDGTSLSRHRDFIGPTFVDPIAPFTNDFLTLNGSVRLDWLGSTRGRIGFVATPDNRLMFYGTGGVAYGGGSAHVNVFDAVNGWVWSSNVGSSTRVGWTLGAGVEYAFTNNWILGAEYLYTDLGSRTFSAVPNVNASNFFGANVFSVTKVRFDFSEVRARISYKF